MHPLAAHAWAALTSRRSDDSFVRDNARRRLASVCGGLLLALSFGGPGAAYAMPSNVGAYSTDGSVEAIAHAGGRTYVGGSFTRVGRRSGSGLVLAPSGALASLPEVAGGDVRAVVSDHDGGWYIGGTFTAVGNKSHGGLAHVNRDGSVDDTFTPSVTASNGSPPAVDALALSRPDSAGARTLYVGGSFSKIGAGEPQVHFNLAALDATDGNPIVDFGPGTACTMGQQTGCEPAVRSLALAYLPMPVEGMTRDQPVVFAGGDFTLVGALDAPARVRGLSAVWGVGAVDSADSSISGQVVTNAADSSPSGSPWAPDPAPASAPQKDSEPPGVGINAIQVGPVKASQTPGALVAAVFFGGWAVMAPTPTNEPTPPAKPITRAFQFKIDAATRAVAVSPTGAPAEFVNWKPEPAGCTDCSVRALALDGPTLYFGGDFTQVGTPAAAAGHLAKIESVSDADVTNTPQPAATGLGPGVQGRVRSLARSANVPGTLFVAGDFELGSRVVAVDGGSGTPVPGWSSPSPDSVVNAVATDVSTSSIYIGGDFRSVASTPRAGLAAFDSSGTLLDWAPAVGSGGAPLIHAIAASDTTVYVGGRFPGANGPQGGGGLAAIDATSGNPVPGFDIGATLTGGRADISSLALSGPTLYVGGVFDGIGGQVRDNVSAINTTTGTVADWNPGTTGSDAAVRVIMPACGTVYVGGRFQTAGGQPRSNLAALDRDTGAATGWSPEPDGQVLALARSGPTLFAGGTFARIGGGARQRLAGLDVAGHLTEFDAGIDAQSLGSSVRSLAATDSALYVGGRFTNIREAVRSNLAAVDAGSGEPSDWDPNADGRVNALASVDGAVYVGGDFQAMGTAASRGLAYFAEAGPSHGAPPCVVSSGAGGGRTESPPGPFLETLQPPTPRTTPASSSAVVLSSVRVAPTRVRTPGSVLTIRFRLSRAASVRLIFESRALERCQLTGGRTAVRRICVRYRRFATVITRGRAGINRVSFPGHRVGGRRLVAGLYRVRLSATLHGAGEPEHLAYFRVVRR